MAAFLLKYNEAAYPLSNQEARVWPQLSRAWWPACYSRSACT